MSLSPETSADSAPARRRPEAGAPVRKPWLVVLMVALCFAAAAGAIIGLAGLSRTLESRPIVIVQGADALQSVLSQAPWAGPPVVEPGQGTVWALAPIDCADCPRFFDDILPSIEADGAAVRLILYAPRGEADAAALARVAVWAQARDASLLAQLRGDGVAAPPEADPAAIEGYVEWGRAAHDRIAGIVALNGTEMKTPALFWRRGPEWRALIGAGPNASDHVRREL